MRRLEREEFALATEVFFGEERQGVAGRLVSAQFSGSEPVFVAEIELPNDFEAALDARKFRELQRFPSIIRDIALIAPAQLSHNEILATINGANEPLLDAVELFDLFDGKDGGNIGAGRKSLAYSLTYLDKNRTLTSDEVSVAHDRIRERLKSELGVELRE